LYINIAIDKLTNSVENTISGDSFDTEVIRLIKSDLKGISRKDWFFNWNYEFKQSDRIVFKLIISGSDTKVRIALINFKV